MPFFLIAFGWTIAFHPGAPLLVVVLGACVFAVPQALVLHLVLHLKLRPPPQDERATRGPGGWLWPLLLALTGATAALGAELVRRFWVLPFPFTSPAAPLVRMAFFHPVVRLGAEWLLVAVVGSLAAPAAVMWRSVVDASRPSAAPAIRARRGANALRRVAWQALIGLAPAAVVVSGAALLAPPGEASAALERLGRASLEVTMVQTARPGAGGDEAFELLDAAPPADLTVLAEGVFHEIVSLDETLTDDAGVTLLNRLSRYARDRNGAVLAGVIERGRADGETVLFNTALLFGPAGSLDAIYRKRLLAPFGEYNPLPRLWPAGEEFLATVPGTLALSPGRRGAPLPVVTSRGEFSIGVLICFESAFPHLARAARASGATHLVNVSHDQWSGSRHAMRQHADHALLRSLETGLPIVRVSHGGYSFAFDPSTGTTQPLPADAAASRTVHLRAGS